MHIMHESISNHNQCQDCEVFLFVVLPFLGFLLIWSAEEVL